MVHLAVYIQCSCLSLTSVTWILFECPGMWDTYDLDCILGKGDRLNLLENLHILEWKTYHKNFWWKNSL